MVIILEFTGKSLVGHNDYKIMYIGKYTKKYTLIIYTIHIQLNSSQKVNLLRTTPRNLWTLPPEVAGLPQLKLNDQNHLFPT